MINSAGIFASYASYYVTTYAPQKIAYYTIQGTEALINSKAVVGAFEAAGKYTIVLGALVDVGLSFNNQQSWGKTGLNTGVAIGATLIGGIPGVVVGGGYFVLDKTGMFNGPTGPMNYTPPSIAMPDATNVARPIIYP